ncbi:MAG: SGNH/GDSL hydrolase family protein [Armatimonadota bacterium]
MRTSLRLLTVLVFLLCAAFTLAQPLLKAGDRLVFLGDSITEQRIYTRYVMNYFTLRYPGVNISFRNAGWSGDTAGGGVNRLQRDVLSLNPTVVSICFGMNDGGYGIFNQARYDWYMTSMTSLVGALKKAGVKVVLLTPGAVDPDRNTNPANFVEYNKTLTRFAQGVKELAAKEEIPVCDINALMNDVQTKAKADNPKFTMIQDSVHPNAPGQAVMAYGLLKALGCTDQASGLTIDAAKSAATPDRCTVKDLKVTEDAVTFSRTDDALPMVFDAEAATIYKYLPLQNEINQYRFQATGLKKGNWKLKVQEVEVGTFTSDTLAAGVNLADMKSPWKTLGSQINTLSAAQEGLYFTKWRTFAILSAPAEAKAEWQEVLNSPSWQAMIKKLDDSISAREKARLDAVANRTWTWSLTFVP